MIFIIDSPKYGKHEVLVDDEDWGKIKNIKWNIKKNKCGKIMYACGHAKINNKNITVTLHKYLTGYKLTDHRNGNGLDCRRPNMRECSIKENTRNSGPKKTNTLGYKGIKLIKNKYIISQIRTDKGLIYLGRFETKDQAAIAYNVAALEYHGEYAQLNNIMAYNNAR